jgi:hypothetical protein
MFVKRGVIFLALLLTGTLVAHGTTINFSSLSQAGSSFALVGRSSVPLESLFLTYALLGYV